MSVNKPKKYKITTSEIKQGHNEEILKKQKRTAPKLTAQPTFRFKGKSYVGVNSKTCFTFGKSGYFSQYATGIYGALSGVHIELCRIV
jgi:hypothetical protein